MAKRMVAVRFLACMAVAVALLAVGWSYRAELAEGIAWVEGEIAQLGFWGPLAFFGLFVILTSCFFPDSALSAAAGALFGTFTATAICFTGALIVQSVAFFLSRRYLRQWVVDAIEGRPKLAAIRRAADQRGLQLQVLLRLTPLNPVLLSYVLGTTNTRFCTFLLACLELGPAILLQAYCGSAAKHMIKSAGRPHEHSWVETALVAGGFVACVVLLVVIARFAKQAIAAAETPEGQAGG